MSKYTTQVRFICESAAECEESKGFNSVDEILDKAVPKVFNFDFPIFDERYRFNLEKKILRHFYTREICEETVGLWKLRLQNKLCEIMPLYNQLYESELLKFDPFLDVDLTRTHHTTEKKSDNSTTDSVNNMASDSGVYKNAMNVDTAIGNQTSQNKETKNSVNKHSDTPQGTLANLENDSYMSQADIDTGATQIEGTASNDSNVTHSIDESSESKGNMVSSGTSVSDTQSNNEADYFERVFGKQGGKNYSKLLAEYRKTFLNIDRQIIDDLECLFFMLW